MEVLAEIVGWALGVAGTAAGGGVILLLRWQRRTERELVRIQEALAGMKDLGTQTREIEKCFQEMRVYMAERYVRRDDYIPAMAEISVKLDGMGPRMARVDERTAMLMKEKTGHDT